jgi:hypothetical protein
MPPASRRVDGFHHIGERVRRDGRLQEMAAVARSGVGARVGEVLIGDVDVRMIGRQVARVGHELVVGGRSDSEAIEGGVAVDGLSDGAVGGAGAREIEAGSRSFQATRRYRVAAGTVSSMKGYYRWKGSRVADEGGEESQTSKTSALPADGRLKPCRGSF